MREAGAGLIALVVVVVVAIGVVIAGWQANWWFAKKNVDRQYDVNVHSQQYQAAQIDQLRNYIQAYNASDDDAQKAQIKSTFCAVFPNLTQPPVDLQEADMRIGCAP